MTLFLQERGWVVNLVKRSHRTRGAAISMTFEGDGHVSALRAEERLPGHHNYFLENESRWRTGVPLYGSVYYEGIYPGIDLVIRHANGIPEYDLILAPGASVSVPSVHVEGAEGLSIATDGALVIETGLGPLTQPRPKTWEVGPDGGKREMTCNFALLGPDRFGFVVPDWDGDTHLTIDPGLIWSTFVGGDGNDYVYALAVDSTGVVTVAGQTYSIYFPTTRGVYDTIHNGSLSSSDAFVSRLDPSKTGTAQLVYSTFLGGNNNEFLYALSVDDGIITVSGTAASANFPVTGTAYSTAPNDIFLSRLDPSKTGSTQLVYSTFIGGSSAINALVVDPGGVVTATGYASYIPTTSGAFDTTWNGADEAFVSRLDPSKAGSAQLVYSTYLGGSNLDQGYRLAVDASGVVTVAGRTQSSDFPATSGAFDTARSGDH